ncbi:hypothetical protein D1872_128870 [compost metagenome]
MDMLELSCHRCPAQIVYNVLAGNAVPQYHIGGRRYLAYSEAVDIPCFIKDRGVSLRKIFR